MRLFQSSQKPASRLKPPTITRSSTLTSSINKIDTPKPVQLPDIVPNATPQPVTLNESIVNDAQVVHSVEPPVKIETLQVIDVPPLPVDEGTNSCSLKFTDRILLLLAPETIEADFTDSVSLILRQLQQEEKVERRSSSITISEEDSDDDDGMETESVVESIVDQTHRSSISSICLPPDATKCIQTDLSFPTHEQISFSKVQTSIPVETKKKLIVQPTKKPPPVTTVDKRPIAPPANPPKRTIARKPAIIPAKKGIPTKTPLHPTPSVTALPTQSSKLIDYS